MGTKQASFRGLLAELARDALNVTKIYDLPAAADDWLSSVRSLTPCLAPLSNADYGIVPSRL
jgi:hypothetical protein